MSHRGQLQPPSTELSRGIVLGTPLAVLLAIATAIYVEWPRSADDDIAVAYVAFHESSVNALVASTVIWLVVATTAVAWAFQRVRQTSSGIRDAAFSWWRTARCASTAVGWVCFAAALPAHSMMLALMRLDPVGTVSYETWPIVVPIVVAPALGLICFAVRALRKDSPN